ncbi:esterase/lipase family protein [Streptomyces sp. NBC_01262]|uniref:esterase/lipase family protein n=1 Tax=Streptomyces sp. NBC_01262 TaxID=2903803 RepID=UPI002E37A925|nr:alpha/beta fold hydrolase [Streptomyces sp. NBC_01262]
MLPSKPRILARVLSAMALTATLAAAPVLTGAATAEAATVSSGWNDYSCKPSSAHPRPVVLVHGTLANSVDNWLAFAPYLVARGYCVFSLDYGQLPGVPVFYGLGPVADSAQQLSDYVDTVLADTGASKVDLVGHSEGGMMPRYYLKFLGGAAKVNALVGIAPDNHGTTLDGITALADLYPAAAALVASLPQGLQDQIAGSAFLTKLNAGGDTVSGVKYTVIVTKYDEIVTPYTSGYLSGSNVTNLLLQDSCSLDLSEHATIGLTDVIAFHLAANALDPAHATPATCLTALTG